MKRLFAPLLLAITLSVSVAAGVMDNPGTPTPPPTTGTASVLIDLLNILMPILP